MSIAPWTTTDAFLGKRVFLLLAATSRCHRPHLLEFGDLRLARLCPLLLVCKVLPHFLRRGLAGG